MAITKIIDLIKQVEILLQDVNNVRWSRDELLSYLLDAQLAVINRRPDANMKTASFSTKKGTYQSVPDDCIRLMKVIRNTHGRAIRDIPMQILDNELPDWHVEPVSPNLPASEVELYTYDVTNPRTFYVYPYVADAVEIEIVYAAMPNINITISDWSTDNTVISVDDSYKNALIDWVLYRSYSKDADYTSNSNRAQMHMQAFNLAVQSKTQADVAMTPQAPIGAQQ